MNQRMPSIHSFNTHTLTPSLPLALCLGQIGMGIHSGALGKAFHTRWCI